MSGHSKWATIKRQKGAADLKRGLAFTKISNAITIAVKQGGGAADPASNFKLRLAMEKAAQANMSKENVQRAIDRAAGKQGTSLDEVVYEGFAPFGISLIIEAATDNPQRTTAEIKNIFSKEGGNFGQPGSVAYQFKQVGKINVKKESKTFDQMFEIALDSGAEDIAQENDKYVIYTQAQDLSTVRNKLIEKGVIVALAELIRKPLATMPIADKEQYDRVVDFIQKLEDMDDVQRVYSNLV